MVGEDVAVAASVVVLGLALSGGACWQEVCQTVAGEAICGYCW